MDTDALSLDDILRLLSPQRPGNETSEANYSAALGVARKNKIAIPFHRTLSQSSSPEYSSEEYKVDQKRVAQTNLQVLHIIHTVNSRFKEAGIQHVFYKGPLQQKALYGDFFSKPCSDADVLVPKEQFAHARNVLETSSFELPNECRNIWWSHFLGELPLFPSGRRPHSIDLHHRLQQPGSPAPRHISRFFKGLQTIKVGSLDVPIPGTGCLALIAAMNLVKAIYHRQAAGNHALDLVAALHKMNSADLTELTDEADVQGLTKTLYLASDFSFRAFRQRSPLGTYKAGHSLTDDEVRDMIFHASDERVFFPKRSKLLVMLCDNAPVDLPVETFRWGLSEASRIIFQPK